MSWHYEKMLEVERRGVSFLTMLRPEKKEINSFRILVRGRNYWRIARVREIASYRAIVSRPISEHVGGAGGMTGW